MTPEEIADIILPLKTNKAITLSVTERDTDTLKKLIVIAIRAERERFLKAVPEAQQIDDGDNETTKFGVKCFNACRAEMLKRLGEK